MKSIVTGLALLLVAGLPIPTRAHVLLSLNTMTFNGNFVEGDSFDSQDPLYSINGLYPFGDLSKTKDNGDLVVNGSLNLANSRIKGFLRLTSFSGISIGPSGSVGNKSWVEGGLLGIQPGHLIQEAFPILANATLPVSAWIPAVSGSYHIDGASYKYAFTTSGDYTLSSVNGAIFIGTNAQVRLKITGAVNLSGNSSGIRIADGANLQIFMTGDTFALAGAGLVNDTGRAAAFVYFGLPSNTS